MASYAHGQTPEILTPPQKGQMNDLQEKKSVGKNTKKGRMTAKRFHHSLPT